MDNKDWRAEDANEEQIVALRRHGGEYRKEGLDIDGGKDSS